MKIVDELFVDSEDCQRVADWGEDCIPNKRPDPIQWAEQFVVFPLSAMSKHFKIGATPWNEAPIRWACDRDTRIITYMKPVQCGGSAAGEVVLQYWIKYFRGILQYNWSNDKRSNERYDSRIEGILQANPQIAEMLKMSSISKGEINFGSVFFRMQGVFESHNLDSDSIPLQINEEVHDWKPGHLMKARNRQTQVWNYKGFDISNAGVVKDQLHEAFNAGTRQYWEILCPGCKQRHRMVCDWDDKKPDLGGIRADEADCKIGVFDYDYTKLRPTIRYQMPCGYTVHNQEIETRRRLSDSGQYSEPTNKGAELAHRSCTFEAASVHQIDFMMLLKDRHAALKARALGDPAPYIKYCQERRCIPYDPNDVPIVYEVTTVKGMKKNRNGLDQPRFRAFALDRQQGDKHKGEFPYWWLVIRDFKIFFGVLRSMLVWEGKVETDEQVIHVLDEHGCIRHHGCADPGDDTDHVYQFCMRNGINAIKGGAEQWYMHNGVRRSYSTETPLHAMLNYPPKFAYTEIAQGDSLVSEPDIREPMFWLYSKSAIAERLNYIRGHTQYETPEDVSEDYRQHHDAEVREVTQHPRTGQEVVRWVQKKRRNDLLVCERYIVMELDMTGAVGDCDITEAIYE